MIYGTDNFTTGSDVLLARYFIIRIPILNKLQVYQFRSNCRIFGFQNKNVNQIPRK
jgi:hypothetical protein